MGGMTQHLHPTRVPGCYRCDLSADEFQPRIEEACEVMHDAYERAAVGAGWDTNPASRKPWSDVPEANKATMRAAVAALFDWLLAS